MKATRRMSAPRSSLIATIPEAPPGRVPSAAVAGVAPEPRPRAHPATRLRLSTVITLATTAPHSEARTPRDDGVKVAPIATPMTAWAPRHRGPGTSTAAHPVVAATRATTIGPTSQPAGSPSPLTPSATGMPARTTAALRMPAAGRRVTPGRGRDLRSGRRGARCRPTGGRGRRPPRGRSRRGSRGSSSPGAR